MFWADGREPDEDPIESKKVNETFILLGADLVVQ